MRWKPPRLANLSYSANSIFPMPCPIRLHFVERHGAEIREPVVLSCAAKLEKNSTKLGPKRKLRKRSMSCSRRLGVAGRVRSTVNQSLVHDFQILDGFPGIAQQVVMIGPNDAMNR